MYICILRIILGGGRRRARSLTWPRPSSVDYYYLSVVVMDAMNMRTSFYWHKEKKKEKNLGREGLSSDGAFDFEWQRKSEPVLSTIKRERAHRKEEEAELRVHIITVGSLLLPLFFHSPGSGDLGDPCCSRTIVTRGWERPTPFQLGGESKREHRKKVTTLVRQRMLNHPNVVTKWTDHNTSIHDTNFFFPFNLR